MAKAAVSRKMLAVIASDKRLERRPFLGYAASLLSALGSMDARSSMANSSTHLINRACAGVNTRTNSVEGDRGGKKRAHMRIAAEIPSPGRDYCAARLRAERKPPEQHRIAKRHSPPNIGATWKRLADAGNLNHGWPAEPSD